jgi:hypothetical protein
MKHINKKTLNEHKFSKEDLEKIMPVISDVESFSQLEYKELKGKHAVLFHADGLMSRAFFFKNNETTCTIPLADPVLLYFNEAYKSLKSLIVHRKELLDLYSKETRMNEHSIEVFYNFFGAMSTFIILLYSSMEAFVNYKIPKEFVYKKSESGKYLKVYNIEQIQRWIPLEEKISCILTSLVKKSFFKDFPIKHQHIVNLENFRDSIIHTKKIEVFDGYESLYKTGLRFKYEETIEAVKDFINYYEDGLIEPCPCDIQD